MEHSVFHSFHNLITKANATREELTLLCNDYPTTPLTWLALYRILPPDEGRPLLLDKARELCAVDLWREIVTMPEDSNVDVIQRYALAKEAVAAVGLDPRSSVIWANFLGLYAVLHNAFLAQVTRTEDNAQNTGNSYISASPHNTTSLPSAVAPLGQLVPAEKSYSERHASTVGNLSINTFFTVPAAAGSGVATVGQKHAAVENALLTSPIAFLAPDAATMVQKYPPPPEALRALVAAGDLNLVSFCNYLQRLCMTPVQDVPIKSVRQVLSTLMPNLVVEPAATSIQNATPIDFEGLYPIALFQRPTSAIVPTLESVSVPGWTAVLQMEISNWFQLKETSKDLYNDRVSYFFKIALRQCSNVPDIKFLQAQRCFADNCPDSGVEALMDVPLAARHLELALVISDAQEFLRRDSSAAINTLCKALTQELTQNAANTAASHSLTPNSDPSHLPASFGQESPQTIRLGTLIYRIVLKRLRQGAPEELENTIEALLADSQLRPALSERLLVSLLILCSFTEVSPSINCKAILESMLQILPYSPMLLSLQHTQTIAWMPNYLKAYVSQKAKVAMDEAAAAPLPTLLGLALDQIYQLGSKAHEIVDLMRQVEPIGMLCTPQGAVDYQEYTAWAMKLPADVYCCVTRKTAFPMVTPPVTPSSVKGVIEMGRKLDTLVDIARQLRDGSLKTASPNDFKAAAVLQVFQKAVSASKHLLTERQANELQALANDQTCLHSLKVWLNDAS